MTTTALIRKLTILRFRGLEKFEWHPQPGMNIVLGGGDVGKSTVLEAIALLLSPSNATVVSESDYWQRDSTQEFMIEAVMALPAATGISTQRSFLRDERLELVSNQYHVLEQLRATTTLFFFRTRRVLALARSPPWSTLNMQNFDREFAADFQANSRKRRDPNRGEPPSARCWCAIR